MADEPAPLPPVPPIARGWYVAAALSPLLVVVLSLKITDAEVLTPLFVLTGIGGWVALAFCQFQRQGLKVLLLLLYLPLTFFVVGALMIMTHGIPGGPF